MSQSDNNSSVSSSPLSGTEIYELIIDLCKDEMQVMLVKLIESAESFSEWKLSDSDSTRLASQLSSKKRIIKSTFAFQLEKGFSDLESTGKTLSQNTDSDNRRILQPVGVNSSNEIDELETTLLKLEQLYTNFYQTLIQRFQFCLNRTKVEIDENPMHLKYLCEAFQNSIESLKLESKYNLALYRLYASTILANLAPVYRKLERCLLDHNILPELKPARFSLRSCTNLSESLPPKSLPASADLNLVLLLQNFKEKSRDTTTEFRNLFPELKEALIAQQFTDFDQPLEQLGLQFKIIFNDEDLPPNIKAQLARLQVYFFISAIREKGFLTRSSHPARRLIDTVVMSEVEYATSDKPQLSGHNILKDGIDRMVSAQSVNSESYRDLLNQYKSRPETVDKKENKTQPEPGPEDPKDISQVVESMLESIVEPLKAQQKSLQIFEEVWAPLMLEVALTQGFNSPAWNKVVAIVKTHVWALIPKNTEKERTKLMAAFPQVARSLKGVMQNLKFTAREQKLLLDNFTSEHDDVLERTSYNIGQATQELKIISAKNRILESLHESIQVEEPDQKELIGDIDDFFSMIKSDQKQKTSSKPASEASKKPATQPASRIPAPQPSASTVEMKQESRLSPAEMMQVGEWIECKQGSKTIMAKLTWKADDNSLYIFVDRDGKRVSEVDQTTLDIELGSGQKAFVKAGAVGFKRNQSSFLRPLGS